MDRYLREDGSTTGDQDDKRVIWYGVAGCNFWTDDWDKIATSAQNPIPHCPECGAVGFQAVYEEWAAGAKRFEEDGHPWYRKFLSEVKEQCARGKSFMKVYEEWKKEKGL